MSRDIYKFITETAKVESPSWTNKEKARFNYFNPNGLYSKFNTMCDIIGSHVESGELTTGYFLAYGSLSNASKELEKLVTEGKRITRTDIYVTKLMLTEHIEKSYQAINAKLGTDYTM